MFITTYTWLVLGLSLLALCEWFNVEVFVAAKTITVKQSCTSLTCTLTGTSYCCPNIRAALRITQDYDRVYITSGEYSGHSNTQLCTSPTYSVQYNCTFHHVAMYGEAQGLVKILGSDTNTRALHIKDTSFALIANITFANFNVDYDSSQTGGAIVVENSTSTFSNIAFHNNSAALGGAISFTRSNVVITDCLFTNNYVKTAGGAVNAVNTNLTIIRTDFLTNVASFFDSKNISTDSTSEVATTGGAISLIGNSLQHVHIIDCHFNNNSAERFGGAIGIEPESFSRGLKYVIIENTQFLGNQVTGIGGCVSTSSCNAVGGAIYVDAFNVTISGSKFIANTVQTVTSTQLALGGAIYSTNTIGAKEASSLSMTKIIGTVFSHNSAIGAGGAIYILNQQFTLINTDFLSNKAFSINKFFSDSPSQGGALWYSGSKLKGSIFNCEFHNNTAHGGWAGAIFATEYSMLDVKDSGFTGNAAISSYTNTAQGGAIMISSSSSISVVRTKFLANAALPEARISPQTYSGEGGAIYAQSSALFFDDCQFRGNYAITGQFDAGSAGGAMLLEDCYPSVIKRSNFVRNGAPGYLGKSSYASQGRGGCIYIKFSATEITDCLFDSNWVSAGGKEASFGGAVAINFDYSSVSSGAMNGVSINNTVFRNNSAFGQICFRTQSGQGGAIGVIGAAKPPVSLFNVNFTNNKVQSASDTTEISAGGAIAITYNSNITAGNCHFHRNVAFLGIGNDIASVATSDNTDFNSLSFADSHFHAASVIELNSMYQQLEDFGNDVCQTVQTCINNATSKCNQYDIFETLSSRRRRRLSSTSVQTRFDLPEYFQAFQWLHIDFNEEDEMVLTLFDRYPIVVAKVSDEEAWSNEKLLIRLVKALRQFQATPDASVTEKLMKVLEIYIRDLENIMLSQSSRDDFETSRRTTSDDPAVVAKDHHIYSRSLSGKNRFDTEGSLLVLSFFRPDIVVTSGYGILTNPTFTGPYHIFCGDYTSFQSQRYSKNTIHHDVPVSFFSELELLGNVEAEQLTLTIVEATVVFDMPMKSLDTMDIQQVNIFNGSLKLSNNIAVSKTSYLFESKIYGTGVSESVDRFSVNANISFIKGLYVGYGLSALFNDNSGTLRDVIDNQNFNRMKANDTVIQTEIAFSSCNIVLAGVMYLDSPFRNYNSTNLLPVPNSIVRLYDNATMFVSANGSVVVLTNTLIDGSKSISPAVINTGNISLIGSTVVLLDQLSDAEVNNVPKFVSNSASQGSLGSSLTIRGTYVQTEVGLVYLTLNSSYQNYPVLNLESDQYLDGSFVVDFYTPGTSATDDGDAVSSANLILYDTNKPSTFTFATYADYTGHNVAQINAPIGLKFSSNVLPLSSVEENNQPDPNKLQNYGQTLQIQNIGCNVISKYYYGVADVPIESKYPCHICLMNSSCDYCGSLGTCQIGGTCGGNQVYTDNCCSGNCMEPYGHCEIDNDSSMNTYSYICRCNWFYSGGDCHDVSTFGYITIFSCAFLVVSAVLIVVLYRRALIQKKKVLDELREGILRHTESGNNEYIQHMQQALILNDVFVKFEEIKLESQIGEGSFGVVHRATFRGAQVAVKQMRSMFIELTEKEIEEFRKEAYMMSRLRHPNIVLVMGISLVDQEPVPLPKSRSMLASDDMENSPLSSGDGKNDKKKQKPQKTVCIITEYLEQGSLADILYGPTKLPAEIWTYELILTCALQAARGMLYLHSHHPPICHRDLKSSNLVVDDHWVVKVTDFGMSRIVPEKVQDEEKGILDDEEELGRESMADTGEGSVMVPVNTSSSTMSSMTRTNRPSMSGQMHVALEMTSNLGTTAWCAPELLTASSHARYSVKVDVYSFGVVLWELWEKKRPFEEYTSRFDIMDAIRAGKRPAISDNCPPTYKSLMTRCWHAEPSRRPTFNYIVRYLKDELARVKRNKNIPPTAAANPPASQTTNRNSLMSNYFRPSFSSALGVTSHHNSLSDAPPTGKGSGTGSGITPPPPATVTNPMNNGALQEEERKSMSDSKQREEALAAAISAPVPIRGSISDNADLPEGRTPLVKAFDRSLSYLTESPSLASPIQPNNPQKYGAGNHAWRDRYVMKFSGWNSSNPDSGLPPTARQTGMGSATNYSAFPPETTRASTSSKKPASSLPRANDAGQSLDPIAENAAETTGYVPPTLSTETTSRSSFGSNSHEATTAGIAAAKTSSPSSNIPILPSKTSNSSEFNAYSPSDSNDTNAMFSLEDESIRNSGGSKK